MEYELEVWSLGQNRGTVCAVIPTNQKSMHPSDTKHELWGWAACGLWGVNYDLCQYRMLASGIEALHLSDACVF